ncbi:MAG: diguanylate cyclase [Alistipes sp.]|jgi:dihydroorotate dehydrogenase (fumarate)|nr:diguanylate cyclase [Alistipes sp.]
MATELKTSFAGIELKNPIIASASPLTMTVEQCINLEKAGVAAIVVKSIFEESISQNANRLTDTQAHGEENYYLDGYIGEHMLSEWRELLRGVKANCTIPVIASIAGINIDTWERYAKAAVEEGVDALELNFMNVGLTDRNTLFGTIERRFVEIAAAVRKTTDIPIAVKIASNITTYAKLLDRMAAVGINGAVLFNRPYPVDIDVEKLEYTTGQPLTSANNLATPLRWTGILSAELINIDLALSGGVQNWQDVVKAILAGASAVEICSTLIHNGIGHVDVMLKGIEDWQERHFEPNIESYRGRMNASKEEYAKHLNRAQHFHFNL